MPKATHRSHTVQGENRGPRGDCTRAAEDRAASPLRMRISVLRDVSHHFCSKSGGSVQSKDSQLLSRLISIKAKDVL
jgi:hypothetical protein